MNVQKQFFKICLCIIGTALFLYTPLQAQTFWERVVSPSGLFETDIRVENESRSDSMLLSAGRAAFSEEVYAVIDHRPYKNTLRKYSVRLDQTFGPTLMPQEKSILAQREIMEMIKSYAKYDFILRERRQNDIGAHRGQSFSLIYNDPEFGPQGVIATVAYADISKITQTIIVPADEIDDGRNREFLESFAFKDGLPRVNRQFMEEWQPIESPHRIYSVRVPPVTFAYFEQEPEIKQAHNAETIRFIFTDPVRKQKVFYNTYGYMFDQTLDFATVEKFLGDYHIRKYRRDPSNVTITKGLDNDVPYIETQYNIQATKKVPYLNTVKLRAYFSANHIFVQEILGSGTLVNTAFMHNVMSLYKFHPEKSNLVPVPEKAQEEMPDGPTKEFESELDLQAQTAEEAEPEETPAAEQTETP